MMILIGPCLMSNSASYTCRAQKMALPSNPNPRSERETQPSSNSFCSCKPS